MVMCVQGAVKAEGLYAITLAGSRASDREESATD